MSFLDKIVFLAAVLTSLHLAVCQNPNDEVAAIVSALSARDFEKANQLSGAALEQHPNNAQLWALRGIAFSGGGDNKGALTAFQRALKIAPNYPAALEGAVRSCMRAATRERYHS